MVGILVVGIFINRLGSSARGLFLGAKRLYPTLFTSSLGPSFEGELSFLSILIQIMVESNETLGSFLKGDRFFSITSFFPHFDG